MSLSGNDVAFLVLITLADVTFVISSLGYFQNRTKFPIVGRMPKLSLWIALMLIIWFHCLCLATTGLASYASCQFRYLTEYVTMSFAVAAIVTRAWHLGVKAIATQARRAQIVKFERYTASNQQTSSPIPTNNTSRIKVINTANVGKNITATTTPATATATIIIE